MGLQSLKMDAGVLTRAWSWCQRRCLCFGRATAHDISCHKPPLLLAATSKRDFLGRWSIGRVGSNAYLHTSRQITERIQQQVLDSLHGGNNAYDESELLDGVREFADKSNLSGQRVRRRHKMLPLHRCEDLRRHGYEEDSEDDEPAQQVNNSCAGEDMPPNETDYFVTVSRRTGFRRLHVSGRCHVHAEKCQQTESVSMRFVGFANGF